MTKKRKKNGGGEIIIFTLLIDDANLLIEIVPQEFWLGVEPSI